MPAADSPTREQNGLSCAHANHGVEANAPMRTSSRLFSAFVCSGAFLFTVTLASGQSAPPVTAKAAQSASAPTVTAPSLSPEASKYLGAKTCKTRHEETYNA